MGMGVGMHRQTQHGDASRLVIFKPCIPAKALEIDVVHSAGDLLEVQSGVVGRHEDVQGDYGLWKEGVVSLKDSDLILGGAPLGSDEFLLNKMAGIEGDA
jgi:hypothetical protein